MSYFQKLKNRLLKMVMSNERYARLQGVTIGTRCNIQNVSFGSEPYLIKIGNHVQITNGTKIFTHGGTWVFRDKYPDIDTFGKVEIKDNVYIGNNTLIMPGVTIGRDVVVGAGSVVTKSIPDGKVVAGNPARVICELKDFEYKSVKYNLNSKKMNYHQKKEFLSSLSEDSFIVK